MSAPMIEYRSGGAYRIAPASEQRAVGDSGGKVFVGEAIVYDQRTLIGQLPWGFYEEIDPGALGDQLASSDIAFLWNHCADYPISRTAAGNLELTNTAAALQVLSDLNTRKSYVNDLAENLGDGTVSGMSFGFYVTDDEWSWIDAGQDEAGNVIRAELRRILGLRLVEVSAVTFPAFLQTSAGLRSSIEAIRSERSTLTLRDGGGCEPEDPDDDPPEEEQPEEEEDSRTAYADDLRLRKFPALARRFAN